MKNLLVIVIVSLFLVGCNNNKPKAGILKYKMGLTDFTISKDNVSIDENVNEGTNEEAKEESDNDENDSDEENNSSASNSKNKNANNDNHKQESSGQENNNSSSTNQTPAPNPKPTPQPVPEPVPSDPIPTPQPEPEPQPTPQPPNYNIGNSGKLFNSEQEAINYGESMRGYDDGIKYVSGYTTWSTHDKYTVHLSYDYWQQDI